MNTDDSSENVDHNRRRSLGTAAMTVASAHPGTFNSAKAETTQPKNHPKRRKP
jgi:hypothetical protein